MTDKKELVAKLFKEDKISMDEMLLLLQTEKEYISAPYPTMPAWPSGGWWEWHPYSNPLFVSGTISTGTLGTLTVGDSTSAYSVTSLPPGTVMSFTSN